MAAQLPSQWPQTRREEDRSVSLAHTSFHQRKASDRRMDVLVSGDWFLWTVAATYTLLATDSTAKPQSIWPGFYDVSTPDVDWLLIFNVNVYRAAPRGGPIYSIVDDCICCYTGSRIVFMCIQHIVFWVSALRHDSDDPVVESIHDIVISRYSEH